jgi:hypothetical protein
VLGDHRPSPQLAADKNFFDFRSCTHIFQIMLEILLIQQVDTACMGRKSSALREELESCRIDPEWLRKVPEGMLKTIVDSGCTAF